MIQWMPYYSRFTLFDVWFSKRFDDSLLLDRMFINRSFHQQVSESYYSTVGIVIIFISLIYSLTIPAIAISLANLIDIYIFGLLFILYYVFNYLSIINTLFIVEYLLSFISSISGFLLFLSLIECCSIMIQSVTITNRISINIIAGGLLINILFLGLDLFVLIQLPYVIMDYHSFMTIIILSAIFNFEILSMINQYVIFIILLFIIIY